MKIEISLQIYKQYPVSNFMAVCPVEAELFHADGQTRHDEANSLFSQFWERA
jgi:hypothetical protein